MAIGKRGGTRGLLTVLQNLGATQVTQRDGEPVRRCKTEDKEYLGQTTGPYLKRGILRLSSLNYQSTRVGMSRLIVGGKRQTIEPNFTLQRRKEKKNKGKHDREEREGEHRTTSPAP